MSNPAVIPDFFGHTTFSINSAKLICTLWAEATVFPDSSDAFIHMSEILSNTGPLQFDQVFVRIDNPNAAPPQRSIYMPSDTSYICTLFRSLNSAEWNGHVYTAPLMTKENQWTLYSDFPTESQTDRFTFSDTESQLDVYYWWSKTQSQGKDFGFDDLLFATDVSDPSNLIGQNTYTAIDGTEYSYFGSPSVGDWTDPKNTPNATLKQMLRYTVEMNFIMVSDYNFNLNNQYLIKGFTFEKEGSVYPGDIRTQIAIQADKQWLINNTFSDQPDKQEMVRGLTVYAGGSPSQSFNIVGWNGYTYLSKLVDGGLLQFYNLFYQQNNTINIDAATSEVITGWLNDGLQVLPKNDPDPNYPGDVTYSLYRKAAIDKDPTVIWKTTPNWVPNDPMGMQHQNKQGGGAAGLIAFGNRQSQYGNAGIYHMFSVEDKGNSNKNIVVPAASDNDAIVAFGSLSVDDFITFVNTANNGPNTSNNGWGVPENRFALFQYEYLPRSWFPTVDFSNWSN